MSPTGRKREIEARETAASVGGPGNPAPQWVGVGIQGVKSVGEVWGSRPRGRILGLPPSRSRGAAAAEVADAGERLIAL